MTLPRPGDLVVTRWGAQFLGRRFACSIGKGGIVRRRDKREGDGATPTGVHRIVGMMYRPDRIAAPVPGARTIGPADLWSDDAGDARYNHHVRAPYRPSHERLRRADPQYDLVLITDWNWPRAKPGHGSAIFIHQWRSPRRGTAGCVAFARRDLHWIARHLTPASRLIVRG